MNRLHDILSILLRWLLGAVFIFSGVVKCVDPVGTAIYVEKYLATYSLSSLAVASEAMAVMLMVLEFAIGLLLILGVWRRGVALMSSAMLLIFTIITLLSATVLPIGDCGCFGDAVKLSPWETLFKNLLLLPISVYIWRRSDKEQQITKTDIASIAIAIVLPLGISLYALHTMPLVDFLPYKVGVDLRNVVRAERAMMEESTRSVLRFRDLTTDAVVEFDVMATECWSDENLEFVDSVTVVDGAEDMLYRDFVLYTAMGEDVTMEILDVEGRIALLCINDAAAMNGATHRAIEYLYSQYPSSAIYVVSASAIDTQLPSTHLLIDAMTLRSIMRADVGIVVLRDGVVEYKGNI